MRTRLLPALSALGAFAALALAPVAAAARTTISARVRVRGSGAQLVARLCDLDPWTGRQRLIDRGIVRLRSGSAVSFRLNGNGWRFRTGHRVRVELLGRDAPTYRASNGTFRVEVSRLSVALPARERRPR